MSLPDSLTARIQAIARREGRSPEAVLAEMIEAYEQRHRPGTDPVEEVIGVFEDDVTDLSVTVRDTLRKKFTEPDDGSST